ncbi:MAG: glycoside hydrolase family 2 protein [Bryobacteraceae bacterium]|jgi:exo-1,4-beta-D-glucosaminidase
MKRTHCLVLITALAASAAYAQNDKLLLREGWAIQPSSSVRDTAASVSTPGYPARLWYKATMPSTVVSALVRDQVYPDPYTGMNLRAIAGTTYPIASNFSNIAMPPESPFRQAWWFRTEFSAPESYQGKTLWLRFDGINYRANVWLNGKQIAESAQMAGAWRLFEYNVTGVVKAGQKNCLAVEIFPPEADDLGITFVDWNPAAPDKGMGLWRDVHLDATGPVAIRFPQVITRLNLPNTDKAELTVTAEARNGAERTLRGTLKGSIEALSFSQEVELAPGEAKVVTFTPDRFAQLKLDNPRLWWPVQVGPQNLYPLKLQFETGGLVSDESAIKFGIREVTSKLDAQNHRVFQINGKNILIRGAGYTFDMLLRSSPERQQAELSYVRDMNLNTVRMEGKLENDHFFELTDEMGILVLTGWCCCDHWEKWANWKDEDHSIAAASLRDQIRRLRSHPSVFNWLNGSDNPPVPQVERRYIEILKELNWPNPYQSSATQKPTEVSGETGLKMTGPYEYVAPSYWLLDTKRGGAHGFNTETSPGPSVPPIESLQAMLPQDKLWPINSAWDYHTGGGPFRDLHVFTEALNARYGKPQSLEEYARKAQVLAYESHRAMFEAFGRNKYTSTGVIQWMLNNAWPSMIWHLYDWYLRPGGSYFGAKKANEPLHIQYSYDDRSIVVVNSFYQSFAGMKAQAWVYNLDMTEKWTKEARVDVTPDSSTRLFNVPALQGLSGAYFVRLALADSSGKTVSTNFYWLSAQPEELDWDKSTWYVTPTKTYADMTALNALPRVQVKYSAQSEVKGDQGITRVTVENPSKSLAFSVHLKVNRGEEVDEDSDDPPQVVEILPVLWEDNYFTLLPGEKRTVTATYHAADLGKSKPVVQVDGWNVSAVRN